MLPGKGHPHCPLGTFHDRIGIPALLAQPRKLLETGPEQGFHTGKRCWIGVHLPVQLPQIHAGPETLLKRQLGPLGLPEYL